MTWFVLFCFSVWLSKILSYSSVSWNGEQGWISDSSAHDSGICSSTLLGSDGKESTCNMGDLASIPGLGRSPGEGNGNPLQYSWLENSMDRETWQATVYGIAKRQRWLSDYHFLLEDVMDTWNQTVAHPRKLLSTASLQAGKSSPEVTCVITPVRGPAEALDKLEPVVTNKIRA